MRCTVYIKAEDNKKVYHVPIIQNLLRGSLNWNTIRAMQIMLDDSFRIGDYINLKELVDKIGDKKRAYGLLTFFLEEMENEFMTGELQPSERDFYRACNVMEELYRHSQSLDKYPLGVFAINFE